MFESFLNPAYLLAGTALISLPILIHLINRMRYKRLRWAAMEFLLKSQKRNRRRLVRARAKIESESPEPYA